MPILWRIRRVKQLKGKYELPVSYRSPPIADIKIVSICSILFLRRREIYHGGKYELSMDHIDHKGIIQKKIGIKNTDGIILCLKPLDHLK